MLFCKISFWFKLYSSVFPFLSHRAGVFELCGKAHLKLQDQENKIKDKGLIEVLVPLVIEGKEKSEEKR